MSAVGLCCNEGSHQPSGAHHCDSEHVTMVILKGRCPRHQGWMWLYASHFFVQLCRKQLVVYMCATRHPHIEVVSQHVNMLAFSPMHLLGPCCKFVAPAAVLGGGQPLLH